MNNLKKLVIALLVLSAIGGVTAQAASAAARIGTTEGYPARLTGAQVGEIVQKIENDTLEVKCPVALFTGELAAESATVSGVTAEYKGEGEKPCKAFGLNATVNMGGGAPKNKKGEANSPCTYTYNTATEVETGMKLAGTIDVVCPTVENEAGATVEQKITLATATCQVQIGGQTGLGAVTYEAMTNTPGEQDDIRVNPAISKTIAYKETKDGIGCPLTHLNEARTDGSYTGTITVTGEDSTTLVKKELFVGELPPPGKTGTTEGYPARLTGAQVGEIVQKWENDTLEVKCPVALFAGEISAESETVSGVTAEYKGEGEKPCKAFGLNATYNMNGCTYTYAPGTQKVKEMEFQGTVGISCPAGKEIAIATATCELKIGTQAGLGPITYGVMTNTPAEKNDITFNPSISKQIAYKETKDGIGCPLTHLNEARTDGSYSGTITVTGENPENKAGKELFIK